MNEFEQKVLIALEKATQEQATEPPVYEYPAHFIWQDQAENGIRWHLSALFGSVPETHRKRILTALRSLEQSGHLTTVHRWGARLTHARLTDTGRAAAAGLLAAQASEPAK